MKVRDPKSSLSELEDMSFLRDLGLIKEDEGVDKLTIAGLLFVVDTVIRYVKAKSLIEEYLQSEGILRLEGKGRVARYYRNN